MIFLQWALPRLGRRWEGYRKVRKRVCRRIFRRVEELGLTSLSGYRRFLQENPREWPRLDALTDVTISRFYRDRAVYDFILSDVFPSLIDRAINSDSPTIRIWSAGCASGEEPYTLAIMWRLAIAPTVAEPRLEILGTDIKSTVLERAATARYPRSAVRDLPSSWRESAFTARDDDLVLEPDYRKDVSFAQQDIRRDTPGGSFDLIICRYQAFTYFDTAGQEDVLRTFSQVTQPGGVLILGNRERPPLEQSGFRPEKQRLGVFRRHS